MAMQVTKKDREFFKKYTAGELSELLQQNEGTVKEYLDKAASINEANQLIQEVLKEKQEAEATDWIEKNTDKLGTVLELMEHSVDCRKGKPNSTYVMYSTPGIYEDRHGVKSVVCPKCLLEYLLENSWMGTKIKITAQFDLEGEGHYK